MTYCYDTNKLKNLKFYYLISKLLICSNNFFSTSSDTALVQSSKIAN